MRTIDMKNIHNAARERDVRLENLAAELTSAVYPLVLRRGPKDAWLMMELDLWQALAETVKKWTRRRPPAAAAHEFKTWREDFLVALTECAFRIALNNGIRGSLLELASGLYGAVRPVIGRYDRVC